MADSVKVRIDGDDSGFKKSLSGIENVAKKGFSAVTKGIAATSAGLAALTVTAVKSYGEYEQLIGGVDTLFEESSKKVQQNAAKAYRTAGLSVNEYMETATSFAASLKQSFDDTAEGISAAADVADMAVIDMADNANKMGTAMESIQIAYQGFAKQNYTMLDNLKLGYGGTKEEMQRLLADAEKISGIKYDISNLADVYNAIHVIQTELGITGTTAKEASTTIIGSANMMKSAWSNMMTGIADDNADMDRLMDELIDSVLAFADNLMPRVETAVSGIGKFAAKAAEKLMPEIIDVLTSAAPDLVDAAVDTVSAFVEGILDNADSVASAAVEIGITLAEGLFEIIPEVIDAAGEIISAFADELGNAVPILKPLTSVVSMLSDNIGTLTPLVIAAVAAVKGFGIASSVTGVVKNLAASYQTAALQVGLYTAQLGVSTIANTTDAAALTAKEIIVGVLTGKISLATAAQTLWNAVMTANPIGLIIAAVALLAGGITALVVCINKETEAEKAHREAVEANSKAISDHAAAVRDRTEAMRESASEGLSSIAHTKNLTDELLKLADAEGNVAEADRGRAEFILGELNSALGTEYQMIDGQIQKYGELKNSIHALIEAKKLEILTNAGEETYSKAITERTAVLQNQVNAYKAGGEQMKQYAELQRQAAEAEKEFKDELAKGNEDTTLWNKWELAKNKAAEYLEQNKQLLQDCWAADDAVNQNTAAITGYEEALAMMKDGNINGAIEKLTEYTYAAQTNTLGVKKAAEGTAEAVAEYGSKVEIALGGYKAALEACADDNNATTRGMVTTSRDNLEKVVQEYIDAGGEIKDGFITSVDLTGAVAKIDVSDILGDVKTLEASAVKAGGSITSGFAQGMLDGKVVVNDAAGEVGDEALDSVETSIDAHSPSKEAAKIGGWFDEGLAKGIKDGKSEVINAAIEVAEAAVIAAKKELVIKSPSRVMRDEVGRMIDKGLVEGIEEGKTEVKDAMTETIESAEDAAREALARAEEGVTGDAEEVRKKVLDNLKFAHDMDEISDAEYYVALAEYRDKYFKEGSEEWQKYTVEIHNWLKSETEKTAKEINKTAEEARDKELRDLKYAHDMGEKSDEEYYRELAVYRNKYFEEGSEEWRRYSQEIYNWQKSVLDKVQQDAQKAVEEFKKTKEGITSALNDDVADTYRTITVQDGENTMSYTELADIGAENAKLDEYNGMLDQLFERTGGELPDYVMEQLKSMDVDEGMKYMSAMLRASDGEFEAYITSLEEKAEKQGLIADKLLTEDAEKKLTSKLNEIYGTIPEGFFDIGEDSATEFAEGFGERLMVEIREIMDGMVANLGVFASPVLSSMAGSNSVVNSYYNTYNVQPSDTSTTAQLAEIKDTDTLNRMRGVE